MRSAAKTCRRLLPAALLLGLAFPALAAGEVHRSFAAALRDPLGNLPRLLDAVPGQVSSHDRTGGNDDGFDGTYSFLRTTSEGEYVIFERKGPGVVSHIWFTDPAPAGRIRFYFDDEPSPRIDLPILELFTGDRFPFVVPLVGDDKRSSGGFYVYLPMPYQAGLRITTTGVPRFFHVGHLEFQDAQGVVTFDPDLDAQERLLLHATVGRWERRGDLALALPRDTQPRESRVSLAEGGRHTVFERRGSGVIDGLLVETAGALDWESLRGLQLLAYWDGEAEPSILSPLLDYFGASHQPVDYASLPLGASERGLYSFFRMPFATGARILVENRSRQRAPELRFRVFHRDLESPPSGTGRFHARAREEVAERGRPIEVLRRSGRGHYVGVTLGMQKAPQLAPGDLRYLEGDEQIYVDGSATPHLHGTGTEDYFNGGWYFSRGVFAQAFHGHPFRDVAGGRIAAYRFHVLDPIPFRREIQAFLEHGLGNDLEGTRYRLVSYWYEAPQAGQQPLGAPPHPVQAPGGVVPPPPGAGSLREAASQLQSSGVPLSFALVERLVPGVTGAHLLRLEAGAPGDFLALRLRASVPDRYAVRTFHCRGPDAGMFRVESGSEVLGAPVDAYAPDFEPNLETRWGNLRLDGELELRLVVTGKNPASGGHEVSLTGVDLHSLAPYAERWWVLGPFDDSGRDRFATTTALERGGLDLEAEHIGKHGARIAWRKVVAHEGVLDFDRIFGATDQAVAYALTYLHADRSSSDARMFLGSDDGVRVYLGGSRIHENPALRGFVRDQDQVPIRYAEGVTPLLVKIFDAVGGWQLSLRINDPDAALSYDYQ